KPDNVLVVNDAVKVLDFGLAVAYNPMTNTEWQQVGQVAGTLAYLAPEVLQGYAPTQASDVYAVGVIAYELFAGVYPFSTHDITQLLMDIIGVVPEVTRLGDNVMVQNVIGRLLAKQSDQRYSGDANQVVTALCDAFDLAAPEETEAVRESFLQSARFIGRETELNQLETALDDAIKGHGSGWLIGGESGVGKSRLLDELRIRALVRGVTVLRGQGVSDGGGWSYQLWREPLRRLMLSTPLDDLEAGILKTLVPDMDTLLRRIIPDAPAMEGESGQQRLLLTIADLFRRQKRPLLLVLEDLQWTNESLEVLNQYLTRSLPELALLVVGNYRDDERPDLPEKLPGFQLIKLPRFDGATVAELSESMLGGVGKQPSVVDLLQRETEGNVFFLIEIVRALAEDAGQLSDIGTITLPQSIVAGGISRIIGRRLQRIQAEDYILLRLAAVAGRQLDLKLLKYLQPDLNISLWLAACANAAVLEVENDVWRFSHDKLRDGVLQNLTGTERPALHRKVAEALEALYADQPSLANVLAYHWQMVGDPVKERQYRVIAGELLLKGAYYRDALMLFERAQHLLLPDQVLEKGQLQAYMAECLTMLSEYPAASLLLDEALAAAQELKNDTLLAMMLHKKGSIADFQGDFPLAEQYEFQSIELYRQLDQPEALADGLRSLGTTLYQQGKIDQALRYHEESKAIYSEIGNRLKVAQSLNNIANLIGSQGDYATAQKFLMDCLEILKSYGDRKGVANCANNIGVMALNQDDFAVALRYYEEALKLSKEIGNLQSVIVGLYNLGETAELLNDLAAAERYYREGLHESVKINAVSLITAFMTGLARLFMTGGKSTFAAELFGMLMAHPSMINEVKEQLKPTLSDLQERMGDVEFKAAIERGEALELPTMVEQILDQTMSVGA
ncbi:MAG TPA: tetratricopeptide repeat protein, partial [Phototrophicaceae bacterium]|nr:tetratricopeptide repeat protein [Phototrophicaceae bacterium]